MSTQGKKKQPTYANTNVIESLRDLGSQTATQATDAFTSIGLDALTTIFTAGGATSGELRPNQEIHFDGNTQTEAKVIAEAPSAHRSNELQPSVHVEQLKQETIQQLEAVREELKAIAKSLKNLHKDVQIAIEQAPVDPGIYHVNFYDQLRAFLQVLRLQIEDSHTWLAAFNQRKKKMGYWGMFKKHGTNFGLPNERSLATSAG